MSSPTTYSSSRSECRNCDCKWKHCSSVHQVCQVMKDQYYKQNILRVTVSDDKGIMSAKHKVMFDMLVTNVGIDKDMFNGNNGKKKVVKVVCVSPMHYCPDSIVYFEQNKKRLSTPVACGIATKVSHALDLRWKIIKE